MTKKSDPDQQNSDYQVKGVDPDVEAKVDAMMSAEKSEKSVLNSEEDKINTGLSNKKIEKEDISQTGAPLLPDAELPDFEASNKFGSDLAENAGETVTDDEDTQNPEKPEAVATETVEEEVSIAEEEPEESEIPEVAETKKPEEEPKAILSDELGVEDRATEAAVDEITIEESDRILAIEDAKGELVKDGVSLYKKSIFGKIKAKITGFWANPIARRITIIGVLLAIIVVFAVPTSRYAALNLVGVRGSTSLRLVDEKTGQPLKNVEVSLSGKTNKTDIDGNVKLEKVKLGKQNLSAKKPAFADLQQKIVVGWGSNPKGDFSLTAVGSRYVFEVSDFLSGKPVDAEAVSGQYSARSNDNGKIVLVVEDEKIESIDIEIIASDYRIEKLNLPVGSKKVQKMLLVPAKKHAFVTKRDGQYDLYKIDADGKNEELVLKGAGKETEENMAILAHKNQNTVAFISTRGDKYNKDGFALSSLRTIDLNTNEATKIAESERIQLVDFIGNKLVYVAIKAGQSAASPTRHQLLSYDVENGDRKELASTNYFNDVLSARGIIYYSPAEYKVNGQVGFYKIKPDGSEKNTIFSEEVWNLFRVSYYEIDASVGQEWYEYDIGDGQFNKLGGAPVVPKSRIYVDAPNLPQAAWVDERDGKGVLLLLNTETNEPDKVLQTQSGLQGPIYWLDDEHIVYRVTNNSETADYVLSISGGEPKKIIDVTNIAGLDRWYYY